MSSIKLIKKIGQGAFGTVYLGDRNGRKCAVKVGCYGTGNNVISEIHIVMEYCGGGDLHANIKKRRASGQFFPERQVIGWFSDVVRAIEYLHSKDVIHRDIKPLNILKHEDGTIKLGDFGLAKILRSKKDIQASVVGTVIYASPELHLRSVCDAKGDMWSLGCTLYQLCTLEPAFRNASEMLRFIAKRGTLRPLPGSYSSKTNDLINALLQAYPNERPTAAQVSKILEDPSAGSCDLRIVPSEAKRRVLEPPCGKGRLGNAPKDLRIAPPEAKRRVLEPPCGKGRLGNVPKECLIPQRGPGQTLSPQEVGTQLMVIVGPPLLPGQNINIKW
ncbi:serine/threonine-protein kinase Nek3-like isoform X2 [Macrobrachium rosenbergii]|uniref:serine/threonine-protein kinase Nek3-like isoform X2 n=1 Tax=Macrobrachium rosenbergii TaxID=79674 RepID=UPI0034D481FD